MLHGNLPAPSTMNVRMTNLTIRFPLAKKMVQRGRVSEARTVGLELQTNKIFEGGKDVDRDAS